MEGHHQIRRLKWLTLFRVALVTVLLGATITFNLQDETGLSDRLYAYLYNLCTIVYLVCFLHTVTLRFVRSERNLLFATYGQLTGDVLFAAALVLVTGGSDSAFTFFFSLVIIAGAIVLYRTGAVYLAGLSTGIVLFIGLIEIGVLPWRDVFDQYQVAFLPELQLNPDESERLYRTVYNVSVNALAFFGVAFLASWLSEQLRKSAEAIRAQEDRLEQLKALHLHIVGSVPSGLVTIDTDYRITSFNRTAEAVTHLVAADVMGQPITDLVRDLKFVLDNPRKLKRVHREESVLVVDRRRVYIGWTLSPLRDAREELIGYIFMFQNITRVKELERSTYRAEKMAAIGELAAAIAHEIRNPLAAMSGSIQLLRSKLELGGTEERLMNIVLREAEQLNKWITDFLEYSRPPPSNRRPMELRQLIHSRIEVLEQDEAMAGIRVDFPETDPVWVLGDEARIGQVIVNLLLNAAQSMPDGGSIELEFTRVDNGSRPIVELAIRDHGVGIEPEEVDKIFQPFYTTRERGTGLGLAVVHQIISGHDGRISVESTLGEGTVFRILLPLCLPPVDELIAHVPREGQAP